MKELSIEQKAKRYDEVIAIAKECITYIPDDAVNKYMLNMFPELKESKAGKPNGRIVSEDFDEGDGFYKVNLAYLSKEQVEEIESLVKKWNPESEDDRIRKELIKLLRNLFNNYSYFIKDPFYTECIAWLEKQKELKHVDKIEPKFHEGDWVVTDKGDTVQIGTVNNDYYIIGNEMLFSMPYVDTSWHLWTIKDAKKGDVLANDHNILILKESVYDWYTNGTPYSVKAYCGIKPNGNFEIGIDNWSFCGTLHIHPATKEQHDILFQKMKEEGYVWNEDKKELIKL